MTLEEREYRYAMDLLTSAFRSYWLTTRMVRPETVNLVETMLEQAEEIELKLVKPVGFPADFQSDEVQKEFLDLHRRITKFSERLRLEETQRSQPDTWMNRHD